jgi:hypothetical protein
MNQKEPKFNKQSTEADSQRQPSPMLALSINWLLFSFITLLFSVFIFPYYKDELGEVMNLNRFFHPSYPLEPDYLLGILGLFVYLSEPVIWYYQGLIACYRAELSREKTKHPPVSQEDEKSVSSWLLIFCKFFKIIAAIPLLIGWIAGMYVFRWILRFFILVVSFRLMGFEYSWIYFAALLVLTEIILWVVFSKNKRLFRLPVWITEFFGIQTLNQFGVIFRILYSFYCMFIYTFMTILIYDSYLKKAARDSFLSGLLETTLAFGIIIGFMRAPLLDTEDDYIFPNNPKIITILNLIAYCVLYISFIMRYY